MGIRTRPQPEPIRDDEYTVAQAATLMHRAVRSLCSWIDTGELPARRASVGNRETRVVRLADVKAVDRNHKHNGQITPHPGGPPVRRPKPVGMDGLTDRQRDVLRAVCELGSTKDAAPALGIIPTSVQAYLRVIYSKLGLYKAHTWRAVASRACYELGKWDQRNGIEGGWFVDDEDDAA